MPAPNSHQQPLCPPPAIFFPPLPAFQVAFTIPSFTVSLDSLEVYLEMLHLLFFRLSACLPLPALQMGSSSLPPSPPAVTLPGWLGHDRWSSTKLPVLKKGISQGDRPIPNLGLPTTRGSCSVTHAVRDGQNRAHPPRANAAPGPQSAGRAQAGGRVLGGFSCEDKVVEEQQVQRIKPRSRRLLRKQHPVWRAADPPPRGW